MENLRGGVITSSENVVDDEAGSDKTEADGRGKGQNGNEQESELEVGVSDNETVLDTEAAEDAGGVYDFKDNKTAGVITVKKIWDDNLTNEEREIPDIKISTAKPSKNPLGYTVTFHGNKDAGLLFDDGSDVNEVVYNSSGQIVAGKFQVPDGIEVEWYMDVSCKNRIVIAEDGTLPMSLNTDIDLWARGKTFVLVNGSGFNKKISNTVTSIIFTDEPKPEDALLIDVDADGDGGVVAWTESSGHVMKISTQIKDIKVEAAKYSNLMFSGKTQLANIDFAMLDTQNVTDMNNMFSYCSGLTTLDLSLLNTQKVTDMDYMFQRCNSLTTLNLSSFNTQNVTGMCNMFEYCSRLISLDLSSFDTQNVYNMSSMFNSCRRLKALDLSSFNTQNVTNMGSMFYNCNSLTALDLSSFDTKNVRAMGSMFHGCSIMKILDLSSFDTQNVTDMSFMFRNCDKLAVLDLAHLDTSNVTYMSSMFDNCSSLTTLDLSSFDTQKVTDMIYMFNDCNSLITLKTGPTFQFVGTSYSLSGTWQNNAGETFTSGTFSSNVADTYTKIFG